jgi:hypothetical protein
MNMRSAWGMCLCLLALLQWACNAQAVLTQQVEARRLASELQVRFTTAADASNRAVMSDSDEAVAAAAQQAEQAAQAVLRDVEQLDAILKSMGYSEELAFLETFKSRFAEYQRLNAEIHADTRTVSGHGSDVPSLTLLLGRRRIVIAQCDDQLRGLRETLAKHTMNATR